MVGGREGEGEGGGRDDDRGRIEGGLLIGLLRMLVVEDGEELADPGEGLGKGKDIGRRGKEVGQGCCMGRAWGEEDEGVVDLGGGVDRVGKRVEKLVHLGRMGDRSGEDRRGGKQWDSVP